MASRNKGKIKEIRELLADIDVILYTLDDFPEIPEILEDGNSFLENALKKARAVAEATGETALADDSGLEVDALGGAPGIYSARYAGEHADDRENNRKLLEEMRAVPKKNRGAAFRCVVVLYSPDGRFEAFEGRWEGQIATTPAGEGGFGYDPVVYLPRMGMTVAELPSEVKNRASHRGQAFAKLRQRLLQKG